MHVMVQIITTPGNLLSSLTFAGFYILQYELKNVCTQALANKQHDFPWFIKTHPSPMWENHSPLHRAGVHYFKTHKPYGDVLKEKHNKTMSHPWPFPTKTHPFHPGKPTSAITWSTTRFQLLLCEEGWVLAPCLCLAAQSQPVVSLATFFFGHWLMRKAGGRQKDFKG